MAPSTAALFLLFGGLLLARGRLENGGRRRGLFLAAAFLGTAAALTLLVLSSVGILHPAEHLGLSIEGAVAGAPLGHMSPLTALGFLLAGGGLIALHLSPPGRPWTSHLALALALTLCGLGALLTLTYALGGPLLYESSTVPPALTTSLGLLAMGAGLIAPAGRNATRPEESEQVPGRKVALLLGLALVVGGVGIPLTAYIHFSHYQENFRTQVEAQLTAVADLKMDEILRWREERLGDARVFAGNPSFRDLVEGFLERPGDSADRGELQSWIERIHDAYDYDQVSFVDAGGTLRLSVPPDTEARPAPTEVASTLESGQVRLLDFYRSGTDDRIRLEVLAPIADLGVLRLHIDPATYLYPLLQRWPTSNRTAETLLVRREGSDVLFLNDLRFREGAALRLRIPVADTDLPAAMAVRGREGLVTGRDYRDVPVVAAVRRVPDSPWYLVTRMDQEEIFAPLRERLWWTVGLAAFLLAGMGMAVSLAWKQRARAHHRILSHAEASRRETETRYRNLFESIRDAILVADADRRIIDCNAAFTDLFGYELEEIRGRQTVMIYERPEEFRKMGVELRARMADTSFIHTVRYRTKDGRVFPGETNAFYLNDSDGKAIGFIGLIRDVTARQEALSALQESEERYRTLVEEAPIGIFTTSSEGVPLAVNSALARMLGLDDPEEALAHYGDLEHDLYVDPRRRDEFLRELGEAGSADQFEYRALTADRREIWMEMSARIGHRESDGSYTIEGFVTDITERKKAEAALLQNEAILEGTQELAKVGGWQWDAREESMYWTREVFRIHELSPDELESAPADPAEPGLASERLVSASLKCYPDEARVAVREAFQRCLDHGIPYDLELPFVTARGRELWIRTLGRPVLQDGKVVKVVGHIMDITEQKRARERQRALQDQLVQAQKMESVGKLAGGVAHDFNNMLSVILGNVELALGQVESSSPLRNDLLEVRKAARRSADLTRQLLAFARRQTIAPRILDLNETIESMLKMLRRLIGEDVGLSWRPASDLWPVNMDPAQIDQILANLVINARDAMEAGGRVTIETGNVVLDEAYCRANPDAEPGAHVVLAVSDDGRGMPRETLDQVFEPFFTTKPAGKGTGLGLSTVFGIVKQNRGSIHAYSELGEGTTFRIYLPRAREEADPRSADPEGGDPRGGSGTILLVEDEPAVLELGRRILENLGYDVLAAESPARALELVREHGEPVDALLTDVVMPGLNGRVLAEELREHHPDLPVIYMSGYPAKVIGEKGVLDRAVGFVQKPFTARDLAEKVREALGRR